jgi:predicted NAD-dependent protein-ADP-ribosyltransferase YbiA (DUF1768 family)
MARKLVNAKAIRSKARPPDAACLTHTESTWARVRFEAAAEEAESAIAATIYGKLHSTNRLDAEALSNAEAVLSEWATVDADARADLERMRAVFAPLRAQLAAAEAAEVARQAQARAGRLPGAK